MGIGCCGDIICQRPHQRIYYPIRLSNNNKLSRRRVMFSYNDRPPEFVTTMGGQKNRNSQYDEPDWCVTPHQQQQYREARESYLQHNTRGGGGNSLVAEERDTQIPMNNYQYGSPLSPSRKLHQYQLPPPQQQSQQQLSRSEIASYTAAIKAVKDSMNLDGHRGSVTALRGLWKVFDAAVSELGTELNDSLSNKAIFEANVLQEDLQRQGRRVTDFEKKSDALSRRRHYESELAVTMLRLRGSFADVILGAKKELQASVDQSFAIQSADMEKSFQKKLLSVEKSYTKKAIEAEHSFAMQLKEKDNWLAKKTQEMEKEMQQKIEKNRDSVNIEIAHVHNQLKQSVEETTMVQAQLRETEQKMNMIHAQVAQEREGYRQHIANVEKGRDDAVTKLSSTLETLQNTCASAHSLEVKLHETERKLNDTQQRLEYVDLERRKENEAASQQWSVENERANLLQSKLESEMQNINALRNVQKEMERHLSLERERGDLLQQELDAEIKSSKEVVSSLQEVDRQRRADLDRSSQENVHLKNELESTLEDSVRLRQELAHASHEAHRANNECSSLKAKLNNIQERFQEQVSDLHASKQEYSELSSEFNSCKERLAKMTEMNTLLEAKVESLDAKIEDQEMDLEAARMSEADVEMSLAENLQRNSELQKQVEELEPKVCQLTEELSEKNKHIIDLGNVKNESEELSRKLNELETESSNLRELNKELEAETATLKGKLQSLEEEHNEDRDKIANALANFDEEMSRAEEKLKNVVEMNTKLEAEKESNTKEVETLKEQIKELKEANKETTSDEALQNKLGEERKIMEDKIAQVTSDCKAKVAKYKADISVYEEAISMLKKQVEILQELADAEHIKLTAKDDLREQVKEEVMQEHNSAMMGKNGEIASLREKIERREQSMKKLAKMTTLLRDEKTFLEESLERSILYIQDLKNTQEKHTEASDAIEMVATTPRAGLSKDLAFAMNDLDEFCAPIIDKTSSKAFHDVGSELDQLLSSIEAQLGGQCGSDSEKLIT